ncbi:MAG TPA: 4-(cytidine 5'-diphospho)-2-C-methyl-D-erythritol kinase [Methylomirabilota bacterium]|jgi:4-diphosphocytidyl-2-C-methyl-D-erythritol kinase|nr:4-(cytidine 5'-diphospho)-2-C-methyl-D-erythritol kinase [Methylomirabilota bacterium]
MMPLSLEAPAKINLSLRVVGRRPDGFHLLETEMVLLELADRLLLLPGATGLRVEAPMEDEVPVDQSNLAWRGLVAGLGGPPELACLALEKHIPAAAGLGGGSSDAAAAWRLGRRAAGDSETATPEDLLALAVLGADVPFFAAGVAAALMTGIGEVVTPIEPASAEHCVLVLPEFRLSTAAVFGELRDADLATDRPRGNDLLAPALRLRPELAELIRAVAAAGGEPRLTGSGSTIFTLTDDPDRAAAITATLRGAGVSVVVTRLRREPALIVELDDAPLDGGASAPGMG